MNNEEIIEKYGKDDKLAPGDTYSREVLLLMLNEARADAITEQDRYKIHEKYHELNDKDIEDEARSATAKEIFSKLDRIIVYRYKYKNNHVQIATGTEIMEGDYDYEAFLATFREYIEIKEQYGVD